LLVIVVIARTLQSAFHPHSDNYRHQAMKRGEPAMARKRTNMSASKPRAKAKAVAARPNIPPLAMSVEEFCRANDIGRDLFYALLRQGKAPATMLIGSRRLVSFEAAQAWRAQREAETATA
jgi:excisionase family DNA binding protein